MTLPDFIKEYDYPGSIVLLEGKRKINESDIAKLIKIGEILASMTKHIIFRSGNAEGADFYFTKGVTNIEKSRMQVITPYDGHRKKENNAFYTYSLDNINFASEPEVIYQSKRNKKTEKLIDKFIDGERNRITLKAAYIIRDTIKVLGTSELLAANFAIFYEDFSNPNSGGTGHTMDVCKENNVEYVDQRTWFDWLE